MNELQKQLILKDRRDLGKVIDRVSEEQKTVGQMVVLALNLCAKLDILLSEKDD